MKYVFEQSKIDYNFLHDFILRKDDPFWKSQTSIERESKRKAVLFKNNLRVLVGSIRKTQKNICLSVFVHTARHKMEQKTKIHLETK